MAPFINTAMNFTVPAASVHQMGDCQLPSVSDNATTISSMSNQLPAAEITAERGGTFQDFLDDIGIGRSDYLCW